MTLTRKLVLLVAGIMGATAFVLTLVMAFVLMHGFAHIEASLAEEDLQRIENIYKRELAAMDTVVRDWAWWDDACAFVAQTNAAFIASSFNYETIEQLQADYIGYLHENGEVIWAAGVDRNARQLVPLPESLRAQLAPGKSLLDLPDLDSGVSGILQIPEGPLLVAVRRVLTSDQSECDGPSAVFLLARFLDEEKAADWGHTLSTEITVRPHYRHGKLPAGFESGGHFQDSRGKRSAPVWVDEQGRLCGNLVLRDLEGEPAVCLHMVKARLIHGRAVLTVWQFAGTIAGLIAVALGVLVAVVHRHVVAPMQQLGAEIERIAGTGSARERVSPPPQKELGGLASAVNHLLDAISAAEASLQTQASYLEKLNQCLLSFGADYEKNISSLVRLAGEILGADCALYNRLRGGLLCTLADWKAPDDFERKDAPQGHLCFDVISQGGGQPLVVRHLQHTRYAETDPNVRKYGLQTYVGYPVYCAGHAVGSVCCAYTRDVELEEDQRKFLGIVAAAIGLEEERHAAETQLRESREEWRRTFDLIPDPVCIIDRNFVIQRANTAMFKALNLPPEKVIGATCFECVHGSSSPVHFCPHARVMETDEAHTAEILEENMGGEFLVTCSPVHDAEGRVIGSVHMARDVRELKAKEKAIRELLAESDRARKALLSILEDERRVEAALRESEARYRELVSMLPVAIYEMAPDGRITFLNEFGLKLLGCSAEDLQKGLHWKDFVAPEQHELVRRNIEERLAGKREVVEYIFRRRDGTLFPGGVAAAPIVREGKVVGLRGICTDLTDRKAMEEMRIAKETAERLSRAKSEFLAIMSHELRTPLHTITGFVRALEEGVYGEVSGEQVETLRHIHDAAEHLMQLISDILDLSRIDMGRIELALEDVLIRELVASCVDLVRGREDAAGLQISVHMAPEVVDMRIRADAKRIRQVLFNLLSNSIKFSEPGGKIRVEVAPEAGDGKSVRFSVKDTGVGVRPGELEKIFERFQRSMPPENRWREGEGLGLALAKELGELHGGRIWAEHGENGRGLHVHFVLPVDGPAPEAPATR